MRKLRIWFHERFGFSKREFNGLLGFLGLLFIISALPYGYAYHKNTSTSITKGDLAAIQKLELVARAEENNFYKSKNHIEDAEFSNKSILFQFDPNTIDLAGWQKLGLSTKQAMSIINYRNKGGKFYKPEDLQKMYTISPEKYKDLLPYVNIESKGFTHSTHIPRANPVKKTLQIVEINMADTLKLDEISGIGPAFARRIVNYRERLGGFYKKEQLLEVYGLDSAKFNEIKDQVMVDENLIKKINVNTVQFADLKGNPYLSFKQINAIINYRKQHGDYKSAADLRKVILLDEPTIQKLNPYIIY